MDNKVTGIMKMKKEWIYSIAGAVLGAGLIATMIFFATSKDTSTDCVAVAKYLTKGKGNLIVTADDTASDFLLSREGADLTPYDIAMQRINKERAAEQPDKPAPTLERTTGDKAVADLTPAQIATQQILQRRAQGIPITAPKPAPAHQITVEEVDLTDHEKQLADYMKKRHRGHWEYVPAYVTCLKIEEGRI